MFGKRKKQINAICEIARSFIDESVALLDQDSLNADPEAQKALLAYNFGVIDFLCQSARIPDRVERVALRYLIQQDGHSKESAQDILRLMLALESTEGGLAAMSVGGNAIREFLSEKQVSAVFHLAWLLGHAEDPRNSGPDSPESTS